MKRKGFTLWVMYMSFVSMMVGNWINVIDWHTLQQGDSELALWRKGWVFQDDLYAHIPECTNGGLDCRGVREVLPVIYDPPGTNDKMLMVRAAREDMPEARNELSFTVIPLPRVIPLESQALVYVRWAFEREDGWFSMAIGAGATDTYSVSHGAVMTRWAPLLQGRRLEIFNGQNGYYYAYQDGEEMKFETWYETWFLIDNKPIANGGGRFDVWIRGGHFEMHTHLPNYTIPFEDAWFFRGGFANDQELDKFIMVTGTGSGANYHGNAAVYINALYISYDWNPYNIPDPPDCDDCTYDNPPLHWGSYPVQADNWLDTSDGRNFMGWLNMQHEPWIYSTSLGWVYLPETSVTPEGAWVYVPR